MSSWLRHQVVGIPPTISRAQEKKSWLRIRDTNPGYVGMVITTGSKQVLELQEHYVHLWYQIGGKNFKLQVLVVVTWFKDHEICKLGHV